MINQKVLFILPYPVNVAPSQRFRVEQYLPVLASQGVTYEIHTFFSSNDWKLIYSQGHLLKKALLFTRGFIGRIATVARSRKFDYIFVHREITPIGPPVFEWIIAKVMRKKIIYDFDDAIWTTDKVSEPFLEKFIRWRTKVGTVCSWSYKVSCGNNYLADYARQFSSRVVLNPTTLDVREIHNRFQHHEISNSDRIVIGWTGSHSTLKYLHAIERTIQSLQNQYHYVDFLVIADQKPVLEIDRMIFKTWSKQTEVSDLLAVDIGIMPLPDDLWSKGKCGFKALQYMSLEIPCVASPVGVNSEIIQHMENGMLAVDENDWRLNLEQLILDKALRKRLGKAGRLTVERSYSLESNSQNFVSFFQ